MVNVNSIYIDFEERQKVIAVLEDNTEVPFFDSMELGFCKKFNKTNKREFSQLSNEIGILIKEFSAYNDTENTDLISWYEKMLDRLSLKSFYKFLNIIFSNYNISSQTKILEYLKREVSILNVEEFNSYRLDVEADFLINDIINNLKKMNLLNRLIYLIQKSKEYSSVLICSRAFIDHFYLTTLKKEQLSSAKSILERHYNPVLLFKKVQFNIKSLISETAIKIQAQYSLRKDRLDKMLSNNEVILIQDENLLPVSLCVISFEDWKILLLHDINVLLKKQEYRYLDNLKDRVKVSIQDFFYRTDCDSFYNRILELIVDSSYEKKVHYKEVIKWVDSIIEKDVSNYKERKLSSMDYFQSQNKEKLKLKGNLSPFTILKIFEYFFQETLGNLESSKQKSIKRFVLETFGFSNGYNAFNDNEILFLQPKPDFFNLEYKNEFRFLIMFLYNHKAFTNFSIHRASILMEKGFELPSSSKFGSSGHRDFMKDHWNKSNRRFENIRFNKLKVSILKPYLNSR